MSCPTLCAWTAVHQASLFFTISWSLLKLKSIKSMMPSNHFILWCPLLLLLLIFPSIRGFSNELTDSFYQVAKVFCSYLLRLFHHEWILDFVKSFLSIDMIMHFKLLYLMDYINWFSNDRQSCMPMINPRWLWCITLFTHWLWSVNSFWGFLHLCLWKILVFTAVFLPGKSQGQRILAIVHGVAKGQTWLTTHAWEF